MRTTVSALALTISLTSATLAPACCGLSMPGVDLGFAKQQNIIVWNPTTKTQHFIREAKFNTNAPSMAFIAPTPTKPELAESDSEAFYVLANLESIMQDYLNTKYAGERAASASDDGGLEIIETKDVAGYRATVIKASDSQALKTYLDENGFTPHPSFATWADHYIKKDWYLTAFKVINKDQVASTGVIRMTFKTDQPFNPYYVPKDNITKENGGGLDLYVVAPKAMTGTLQNKDWIKPHSHIALPDQAHTELARHLNLKKEEIPANAVATRFTDYEFATKVTPDDVFFKDAPTAFVYSEAAIQALKNRPRNMATISAGVAAATAALVIAFNRRRKKMSS